MATAQTLKPTTAQTTKVPKVKAPVPVPPFARHAVDGADEPLILSAPPPGVSGVLKVKKAVHDALGAEPQSIARHVYRVSATFGQGTDGVRAAYVRLFLDDEFPNLPVELLPERLAPVIAAGRARCTDVLGAELTVFIDLGGKKLR